MNLIFIIIFFGINCSFSWAQLPLFELSADVAAAANVPTKRIEHSFKYDNNGGFWIFGGVAGPKNDLWRFNRVSRTFTFIDGSNSTSSAATLPNKPTARFRQASWADSVGNFWMFGGIGLGPSWGYLSDTWVYKPSSGLSNKWTHVTGSTVPDERVAGSLEPRQSPGQWRDVNDNNLYIFGGYGVNVTGGSAGSFQSVWKLDPSLPTPTWQFVEGSNATDATDASGVIAGQPVPRHYASCDAAPTSGAYCFGGYSYRFANLNDLWQFNPTSNPKWSQVSRPNTPSARYGHQVVINRAAGKVYVLFGRSSTTYFSDIYSFTISTQQWSTIVASSSVPRAYFGADIDDRNMIHYFAGESMTDATRNDVVSITCLFGEFNNAGTCTNCLGGSYSSSYNVSMCTLCPANTSSTTTGARSWSECLPCPNGLRSAPGSSACCDAGYYLNGSTCVACGPGTFSMNYSPCTSCPANTYSTATGATSSSVCIACPNGLVSTPGSSACSCAAGYQPNGASCDACGPGTFKTSSENSTCSLCDANTYSAVTGATSCLACPSGMGSTEGSSACSCNAGYFSSNGACVTCSAGTFKSTVANSTCLSCGAHAWSAAGSTSCSCNAGYFSSNGACVACAAGTFKSTNANTTCTNCDANFWSSSGATVCTSCGTNAVSIAGSSSCTCAAGYTASGTECVQCSAGTYKSATGNGTCTQCSSNSYSTVVGAASSSTCISCGPNSASVAGSSACTCNAGYESQGTLCVACSAGKFKAASGNGTVCNNCGANEYSLQGASACLQCGANAISTPGSPNCNCNAGYEPLNGACVACTAGKFKSASGNVSCTTCLANEYSKQGATTCIACGSGLTSAAGSSSCNCAAGYEPSGGTCSPCPGGKFKSSSGNVSCTSCLVNEYSNQEATVCIACGTGLTSAAGSASCSCPAGFELVGGTCSPCPAGKFKATSGNLTCGNCTTGYFSLQGATTCLQCGAYATSSSGSSSCTCVPGYFQVGESCSPCTGNTYKSVMGNGTCTACGTSATSNGTTCTCPLTHYGDPLTGCMSCPDGETRSVVTTVTTTSDDCSPAKCLAGYYGNPFTVSCIKCPVNTYRSGESFNITTVSNCSVCPANSGTNGVDGATNDSQCVCNAGYYRNATTSTCVACRVDTFKSAAGNNQCTACATGTATNNAVASTSCSVCAPGYKGNAPNCQACGEGFTKTVAGNGDCTALPTQTPAPNPPGTTAANPVAAMMGVSDEIFYIIIGSVAVALIAAAAATVVIRKRTKKRKLLAKQIAPEGHINANTTGFAPLMTGTTNVGGIPYTVTTNMSMPRNGTVYPMGMQPRTAGIYMTKGTTVRSVNGATISNV